MATSSIKQQYLSELNAIALRYGELEDTTIKRMLSMLKELRTQIAGQVTTAENWELYRLQQLRANVERLIAEFEARLRGEVRAAFERTHRAGGESVVAPLQAIGIEGVWFQPNTAQLNVVLDFSARLIKDIADDARIQVDKQIRLAALGERSPVDAMQGITQALGIKARTGVWKARPDPVRGVAARAETDLRTELQRVFNLSTYSQQLETARRVPGLKKGWTATADRRTRRGHLQAHMTYKDNPIPIEKPFIVYDITESGIVKGRAELMYPGDPNAPPQYTANCRCTLYAIHPAIGRVGSSLDGRIAAELKRRPA